MGKRTNLPSDQNGGSRAREIPDIAALIDDRDGLNKALDTLVELLDSTTTHYDPQLREHVLEIDGATRVKAAQILIEQRVGQAVKRQQILTGKMPETAPPREKMAEEIDRRIAQIIISPESTVSELMSARKVLVDSQAETPSKLTPAEREEEVKRILGVE